MKKSRSLLILSLSFFMSLGFSSCDDDLCSKDLYAFIRDVNNINIVKTFSEDGTPIMKGNTKVEIPIQLTRVSTVDVTASLKTDMQLVDEYNSKNNSNFVALPENGVTISNNDLIVKAGELQSSENTSLQINADNVNPGKYLIPVVLTNVNSSDQGIIASHNANQIFCKVIVDFSNISSRLEPAEGNVIDREGWEAYDESETGYPGQNAIDGMDDTKWKAGGLEQSIVINMGKVHTLKGLSTFYLLDDNWDCPAEQFQIFTSMDGETWTNQGITLTYPFYWENLTCGINFCSPVECQYFKIVVKNAEWDGDQPTINEINAIE